MRVHESLDVLQQCGCTVTKCGLELPPNLSLETWEVVGRALGEMEDKLRWCIGDWWAFGEHRYGDRNALIDDWDGLSYSTCANLGWVAKAFESSRRREHLSIKHHAEVASLPLRAADELLSWCEETREATGKPRPTRELRDEVRRRRIEQMSPRPFGVSETMAVTLAPAPPPDTSTLVLIPVAAAPRYEPEVQQQLGEATPSAGPIVEFRNFLRYAEARLPADASPSALLEAVNQTKQLLGRLTKRLRRSGGDDGDDKVVVNLR